MQKLRDRFPNEFSVDDFIKTVENSLSPEDHMNLFNEQKKAKKLHEKISRLDESFTFPNEKLYNKKYLDLVLERKELRKSWASISDARVRLLLFDGSTWQEYNLLGLSLIFELNPATPIFFYLIKRLLHESSMEVFQYLEENKESVTPVLLNSLWLFVEHGESFEAWVNLIKILAEDETISLEERLNFFHFTKDLVWFNNSQGELKVSLDNILNQLRVKYSLEDLPDSWIIEACSLPRNDSTK